MSIVNANIDHVMGFFTSLVTHKFVGLQKALTEWTPTWLRSAQHEAASRLSGNSFKFETEQGVPPPWDCFPGTTCVRAWAAEARAVLRGDQGHLPWELVGKGVLVEIDDLATGRSLLQRAACDAGLEFLSVDCDDVLGLDWETSPLAEVRRTLIYLEAGEWIRPINSDDATTDLMNIKRSFRRGLKKFLRQSASAQQVIIATAVFDFDDVSSTLRSTNFFPRRFIVETIAELHGRRFIDEIGEQHCAESILAELEKMGILWSRYGISRIRDLHIQFLQRMAHQECRKLEFTDILRVTAEGSAESDCLSTRKIGQQTAVAVHEAGHAVMAIVDSGGLNIPEYLSINSAPGQCGIAVESLVYRNDGGTILSYARMEHKVRVSLAGRCAEELVIGSRHINEGASEDLRKATELVKMAFSKLGFPRDIDEDGISSNLAVVDDENPSAAGLAHVENLVRTYLDRQYKAVRAILITHRRLLDEITTELGTRRILYQADLTNIAARHSGVIDRSPAA